MLALTRRQSTDAREECWHIYYGNVHAGTIATGTGIPHDAERRRYAERRAKWTAAARARPQERTEQGIIAFGGDQSRMSFFGN